MISSEFDDIRPYTDAELPEVLRKATAMPSFTRVASFLFPGTPVQQTAQRLIDSRRVDELQLTLMKELLERIMAESITEFTFSGLENISPSEPHLFISNHRDITLDAFLLQYILRLNGHSTCYITFGANLMEEPLLTELGRCNKMFRVERGGSRAEFYKALMHLSRFIRHVVCEERESLWTAQRNGRTKDGLDRTDPALLKMLAHSSPLPPAEALAELNIVPIAVSYEWEPCDILKAMELSATAASGEYHKRPGEDLASVVEGLRAPKGRVHISICKSLDTDALSSCRDSAGTTAFYEQAASLIDRRIISGYRLWPNNYIAHDLRSGTKQFADSYTDDQRQHFEQRTTMLSKDALRPFLDIYANPVDSLKLI